MQIRARRRKEGWAEHNAVSQTKEVAGRDPALIEVTYFR